MDGKLEINIIEQPAKAYKRETDEYGNTHRGLLIN